MRFYIKVFFNLLLALFIVNYAVSQNTIADNSIEKFYADGIELMNKFNYSAALKCFENYLAETGTLVNKENATYFKAIAALYLYHKDGESQVEDFINTYPTHPNVELANFELGKFYYTQGNETKTIKYLSEVENASILSYTEKAELQFKLGYSYFSKRKFDEALPHFNEIKNKEGQYRAAANYYAGYIEFEQELFDKALIDLKKASKSEAYQAIVPHMLAGVYYKMGSYGEVISYAEPLLNSNNRIANEKDVVLFVADSYFNRKDYTKANTYYNLYLEIASNKKLDAGLMYRIGYVAYLNEDYDVATEMFNKVSAISEKVLGFYASYYLGVLYTKQENKMLAVTAFDKARKFNDDIKVKAESQYQYAKLNYDLGRSTEAINSLEAYAKMFPEGDHVNEVNDLVSSAYFTSYNYDKAISYAVAAGLKSANVREVYQKAQFFKGVDYFNKASYKDAVACFEKSISIPQIVDYEIKAHYWLAESFAIGNKYDQAKPHYQKVLWNATSSTVQEKQKARYGIGYVDYNTKDYQSALRSFKQYVDDNDPELNESRYDDALVRLADCYYVLKQYKNSIATYRESIALTRINNDYAELQLGILYGIEGEYDKSILSYTNVINNYPTSRYKDDATFYRAQAQFEHGDFNKAIQGFTNIISSYSGSRFTPYAYLKRATAYYNNQQYDKCINDYKLLISNYSTHKVAQQSLLPLQEVLALQGRSQEFDQYLEAFKKANPDDRSTENIEFEAAKTLYYNQQFAQANAKLISYMETYPESGRKFEAYFFLGETNYQIDSIETALKYYTLILENTGYEQYNRVLGRVAKIEQQQLRYQNAIYYYGKLLENANNRKEQNSALIGLMENYYFGIQFDSCANYAQRILALGNANQSDINKASLFVGKSAMAKGDFQSAQDAFLQTLNSAKDVSGAEAQYLMGEIFYLQHDFERSIETLIELDNSFHSYDYWVGKGFLLIADNYIAMKEYTGARGTLESLINSFPLPEVVDLAKVKLDEVKGLIDKELKPDDVDTTEVLKDTTVVINDTTRVDDE